VTPAEANAEAARWTGYARAISRRYRPPSLYTRDDWEAEALLGLAVALRHLDRTRPGTHSGYIERVVTNHLKKCIRAVLNAPPGGGNGDPPRATYARAKSLDERASFDDVDGPCDRHDITPSPASPCPVEAAHASALFATLGKLAQTLPASQRVTLGWLLRGATMTEEAEATGQTTGQVRTRRTRVRAKVAEAWA
jgi:DNA-directed RNA polymerase specialized sigma24 family protein